jgi:cellobiose phosphorylase
MRPGTGPPRVQLLSNGSYHAMVTEEGCGYSHWRALALTRWDEGRSAGGLGSFCYLRSASGGAGWSATTRPVQRDADTCDASFSPGRAVLRRRHAVGPLDVETETRMAVAPDDDLELRRVRLSNCGAQACTLAVTSYAEFVLQAPATDAAHPAFEKLFAQTEVLPEWQAVLCNRRPRDSQEATPWAFHLLLPGAEHEGEASYETDRMRFIGRGRSTAWPRAQEADGVLTGSAGPVLDPVASIRRKLTVAAGRSAWVEMITGVAATRTDCLRLVQRCREPGYAEHAQAAAVARAQAELARFGCTPAEAAWFDDLAGSLLQVDPTRRAAPGVLALNQLGPAGLWRHAISGDLPLVLVEGDGAADLGTLRGLVRAHGHWRRHGLLVDLVVLAAGDEGGQADLRAAVQSAAVSAGTGAMLGQPGGIFVLANAALPAAERVLLQSVARIVIATATVPSLSKPEVPAPLPAPPVAPAVDHAWLVDLRPGPVTPAKPFAPESPRPRLTFDNGLGGFSPDGCEYVVTVSADRMTPLPWINVLANPMFGSLVSESGSASTWSENAQLFRLTPWSNDPVSDPNTEAFYLRDEDSGECWSPTLLPAVPQAGGAADYVTRHGFGYSVFEHLAQGIESEMTMFVAIDAPIKFVVLRLTNASGRARRLSVTGYLEWVLGDERRNTAMHVGTELDPMCGALFARNPYLSDFASRVAFFDADPLEAAGQTEASDVKALDAVSTCGNSLDFIGREGSLREPLAMSQPRLSGRFGFGPEACAAIRVPLRLGPGQRQELVFRLGAGTSLDEARQLVQRSRGPAAAAQALEAVKQHWAQVLGAVQVHTPDPSLDFLVNGWLVYQTLACRLWARTAFYQASGAFGFRDQLQDVMALVHAAPALVRAHLLRSAARQFAQGDVQHWWHPPAGQGVRTRCADDALWLPLAVARYVQVTGDAGVLDAALPFVEAPLLADGEVSSYTQPTVSTETQPLYEHCRRAIEHALRFGAHGLPLMGSGDWNDGMNLVGVEGRGESVWLGFFLNHVLTQFAALAHQRGDAPLAGHCLAEAARLRLATDASWDGDWYQRAWFDDGSPLGSARNVECRIDSIAQSWAVLSGSAEPAQARLAMDSVHRLLVDRDAALVRLLAPPFERSDPSPGYIQGYVRGVRENGGQYTHAAVWAAMAFAELGESARAWELLDMLNPIRHSASAQAVAVYKTEPYVLAGDVYALAPHAGRGGWSWYTGSAGWLYRFILESLLGVRVEGDRMRLQPSLPADWRGFMLSYRFHDTPYDISVLRASSAGSGPAAAPGLALDGVALTDGSVRLVKDGLRHAVRLTLGPPLEAPNDPASSAVHGDACADVPD